MFGLTKVFSSALLPCVGAFIYLLSYIGNYLDSQDCQSAFTEKRLVEEQNKMKLQHTLIFKCKSFLAVQQVKVGTLPNSDTHKASLRSNFQIDMIKISMQDALL